MTELEDRKQDKLEDGTLSDETAKYHTDLAKWSKNIDRGYGFVVILAFFIITSVTLGPYRSYGLIFAHITENKVYTREDASKPVAAIITIETVLGPLASIITSKMSFTWCIFIGAVCVVAGNLLGALSRTIEWDVLLVGILQGSGFALIYTPHMDVINHYFIKYRNLAFGMTLTGGSLAVMVVGPMLKYIFANYPWRYSYFAIGGLSSLAVVMSPFLLPNPKPQPPRIDSKSHELSEKNKELEVSVEQPKDSIVKDIIDIFKTHTFHLIWISEIFYYWIFTIWCLVFVDYAMDKGVSKSQADNLLIYQSVGELFGRLLLPAVVDYKLMTAKNAYILFSTTNATALFLVTQPLGYSVMAAATVVIMATNSCSFILLNPLMVEGLGESRVTTTFSLASFICGISISFRPQFIGYFRDQLGTYDPLIYCLAAMALTGALLWLLEPLIRKLVGRKSV